MQRHRHEQVAVSQQCRTGGAHQSGQPRHQIDAVAALEPQHQFAAAFGIDESRAGAFNRGGSLRQAPQTSPAGTGTA